MENYTIILLLLGVMIVLTPLADRLKIASPILLIAAGIVIGFIPDMPPVEIHPEIIFLIFLPPLLYDAAFHIPFKDFRAHFGTISSMAFGLVFLTTGCIAVAAHYLMPGMSWPLSFVLGSILAASDAVAAMSITKNLGLSHRTKIILEGESLMNDASALVAYRFAISAVAGTAFLWWSATTTFLTLLLGGALVGLIQGFLVSHLLRIIRNSKLAVLSFLLLAPFVTYLVAEELEFSGVIAVVVLGLVISYFSQKKFPDHIRRESRTIWELIVFLLNGFVFIILGLELPAVMNTIAPDQLLHYAGVALLITIIAIVVRALRVFVKRKSLELAHKSQRHQTSRKRNTKNLILSAQESLIISWSGMRGIVSLAIAIGIPETLESGEPFPMRSEMIYITTLVILFTIVGQGMVLPFVVKKSTDA